MCSNGLNLSNNSVKMVHIIVIKKAFYYLQFWIYFSNKLFKLKKKKI